MSPHRLCFIWKGLKGLGRWVLLSYAHCVTHHTHLTAWHYTTCYMTSQSWP